MQQNDDNLLNAARDVVAYTQVGSTANLQYYLGVGYARAARLLDMLEEAGVVGPPRGSRPRQVLVPKSNKKPEIPQNETASLRHSLPFDVDRNWNYPPKTLLTATYPQIHSEDPDHQHDVIERALSLHDIDARVMTYSPAARVTRHVVLTRPKRVTKELQNKLTNYLVSELDRISIRVDVSLSGNGLIYIDVPNAESSIVGLGEILNSGEYRNNVSKLVAVIGRDTLGRIITHNFNESPHLLIAGATGSGKSQALETLIVSLLYRNSPAELKLILIDTKQMQFGQYADMPHLLRSIISGYEPEEVIGTLEWVRKEMKARYTRLEQRGVRNILDYNSKDDTEPMPQIMIICDELSDYMLGGGDEITELIVALAQLGNAVGVHMILATSRPSPQVLRDEIKANFTGRLAFTTASAIDSRVILDQKGAETLMGRGDGLYWAPDMSGPERIQGAYISEDEVGTVVEYMKKQRGVAYEPELASLAVNNLLDKNTALNEKDDLYMKVMEYFIAEGKATNAMIMRKFRVAYSRAVRIMDELEANGVVGPANGAKPREVLRKEF